MESCSCYEHDAATIMPILVSQLPYSTTLLRRIQHGIAYPSATAKILATFPAGSTPDPKFPWLAARVDLFLGRETQMHIYSSLEAEPSTPIDAVSVSHTQINTAATAEPISSSNSIVYTLSAPQPVRDLVRAQLLALLSHVKTHFLPPYLSSLSRGRDPISATPADVDPNNAEKNARVASAITDNGVPLIPAPNPQAFLIGSLHTGLFALLQRSGTYTADDSLPNIRVHRFDNPPYHKYFFRRSEFASAEADAQAEASGSPAGADLFADLSLPPGYRFSDRHGRFGVLDGHLDLVQSRTHIPRSRKQLSSLSGMALYCDSDGSMDGGREIGTGDEMPIAWGFLGVDGSLATLHVEPEHRGKGLALLLSKAIMRHGMTADGIFGAETIQSGDQLAREQVAEWTHADVSGDNKASRRVMEKIGGKVLTTVTWTVIELCD
ncbi:uncharacterized protein N7511_004246 [Penicillium nucicola]|uniref:uncharacterized protein n=1 Tax=Penicillium nucicola TaxID=1850975 RepID=UPI002544D659|nr:uncharacterized protein N7511_004246 [Penicillium nucicola]KAJ5766630.1 hypothetical protein N7511_004246 [Penicillium nucicola]